MLINIIEFANTDKSHLPYHYKKPSLPYRLLGRFAPGIFILTELSVIFMSQQITTCLFFKITL